jgi:hypothetical protein
MKKIFAELLTFAAVLTVLLALSITQGAPQTSSALTYDKIPLAKISSTIPFTDINGNMHADSIVWAYQYEIGRASCRERVFLSV